MSRKRPAPGKWAPTVLPHLARKLRQAETQALARLKQRYAARGPLTGEAKQQAEQLERRYRLGLHGLEMAEFFWVTEAMTRVALDASHDMPPFTPEAEVPSSAGFIGFETSLPPITSTRPLVAHDGTEITDPKPVDALAWHRVPGGFSITALCRNENFGDRLMDQNAPFQEVIVYLVPGATPVEFADELVADDPSRGAVLSLLGATWHLMQQPTVSTPTPRDSVTGKPRGPRQDGEKPGRLVTTIDLRTLKHVPTEQDETSADGRTFRHRWVVRGHWRNQAHGERGAKRRIQWIPSYVKGPEGAPLISSEKVMVWRH